MKNIAILASGSGTNAENIINFFSKNNDINVNLIVSNNPDAFVIQRAIRHNIAWVVVNRNQFVEHNYMIALLKDRGIDAIVLAGFLWLIPDDLINAYDGKIINIHPALLPNYGGKGMYGMNVHKAVINNKERQSGITIHKVNNEYDKGEIIFQAVCEINDEDTPESLADKIHELEYKYFPQIIENWLIDDTGKG